jgi:endonuclease/exonuclease/phosphatase family metal-dependent hydrolase
LVIWLWGDCPASESYNVSAPTLHITTFNIHKGFSQFNRRMMVHELRERLRHLNPDIVFLQEVQGLHLAMPRTTTTGRTRRSTSSSPKRSGQPRPTAQHDLRPRPPRQRHPVALSHPARAQSGCHPPAVRKRGLLHCQIRLPEGQAAHCVCAHLSLFGYSRRKQMDALADYLEKQADPLPR